MYAADVRLAFDPAVIEVVDADSEKDGTQIEPLDGFLSPDWVLRDTADNANGTAWYAATQMNPSRPVTGTGDLARITFRGLKRGTSGVTVQYRKITHPNGVPIEATPLEALVHVGGGGPTRTPPPTVTNTPVPSATPPPSVTPTATGVGTVEATPTSKPTAAPLFLPLLERH